ncbi:MAG: hypothetical protein WDA42_07570 [Candidatus Bathyarchaeia archaeon]|jgi:hypothetical protein
MAVTLFEELTKVQRKQSWKDRALLKLVVDYIDNNVRDTALMDLIAYIKCVADEDNKRLQECMERHNVVSN